MNKREHRITCCNTNTFSFANGGKLLSVLNDLYLAIPNPDSGKLLNNPDIRLQAPLSMGATSRGRVRQLGDAPHNNEEGYNFIINGTKIFIASHAKEIRIYSKDSIEVNF